MRFVQINVACGALFLLVKRRCRRWIIAHVFRHISTASQHSTNKCEWLQHTYFRIRQKTIVRHISCYICVLLISSHEYSLSNSLFAFRIFEWKKKIDNGDSLHLKFYKNFAKGYMGLVHSQHLTILWYPKIHIRYTIWMQLTQLFWEALGIMKISRFA